MSATNCLLLSLLIGYVFTYEPPIFINGRPREGFTGDPIVQTPDLMANVAQNWFQQTLDHFNDADNRIWSQRYFVNNYYASKKGPVFLFVGGESALSPGWLAAGSMVDYAEENHAYLFALEHRYYGNSHPTPDMSVENLKYLNSEQALADLATFRVAMAKQYGLTDENKWILFGGSYPGGLSAWFRYKYPHLAHGAVASSAPMKAVLDFPEYLDVSTQSLGTDECRYNVKQATTAVENYLRTDKGLKYLTEKFGLCEPLTRNMNDIRLFTSSLANNFFGIIQYNKDNRAWEGFNGNITIRTLCSIMNDKPLGDAIDRYAAINKLMLKVYRTKCLDVNYDKFIKFMRNVEWASSNSFGARQWTYQTCTEFGYFQSTDSSKQVFGTTWPVSFFIQQCVDIYGRSFSETYNQRGIRWTNANYGAYELANSATRIIFPNGSIDPWHALSFLESKNDIIAIFIKGTSHCANMYSKSHRDSPQLAAAKQHIGEIIKKWLTVKN